MSTTSNNFGPEIPLCKLYERVSKKGSHYLTGRLGSAKIAILKSRETTSDGIPIWKMVLQEAPPIRAPETRELRYERDVPDTPDYPNQDEQRDWQRPPAKSFDRQLDDEIPF